MKKLHLHIARFITFLVALQILNMGLFVQDFQSLTSSSSSISDHNIINSVVEYVSEVVLNKLNAIPENNNKSNKDLQAHKHFVVKIIELKNPYLIVPQFTVEAETKFPVIENYYHQFCKEINPPPPKA
ncbi:MAG: hypothetical protein JWQ09_5389 [Segetibacter sp.]|nr:hypothetical protein [Segetibacter sp.]